MHLNRKGYLTVDVILASVVAVTIAVFLMEITIKLVNITDDEYVNTELMTDKALIIKNIKNLIEEDIKDNNTISSVSCSNNRCTINYSGIRKILNVENNIVYYGDNYSKKLDSSLTNLVLNYYTENDYYDFYITADNKFSKESYRIDIIVKNS